MLIIVVLDIPDNNLITLFILSDNLFFTLTDVDECTSGTATCSENSGCVNQDGSYACICDPGYDYFNGKCIGKKIINYIQE